VRTLAFQFQAQFQSSQPAAAKPQEQDVAEPVQDERERLQRGDGIIQLHCLFEMQRGFPWAQWSGGVTTRQTAQVNALLSESYRKLFCRQFRKSAESPNAPS